MHVKCMSFFRFCIGIWRRHFDLSLKCWVGAEYRFFCLTVWSDQHHPPHKLLILSGCELWRNRYDLCGWALSGLLLLMIQFSINFPWNAEEKTSHFFAHIKVFNVLDQAYSNSWHQDLLCGSNFGRDSTGKKLIQFCWISFWPITLT